MGKWTAHSSFAMKKTSTEKPDTRSAATTSQLKVLRAIRAHIISFKISPTYEELAVAVGGSKRNVRRVIDILVRKGMIAKAPGRYRNLFITDYGQIEARKRTK